MATVIFKDPKLASQKKKQRNLKKYYRNLRWLLYLSIIFNILLMI